MARGVTSGDLDTERGVGAVGPEAREWQALGEWRSPSFSEVSDWMKSHSGAAAEPEFAEMAVRSIEGAIAARPLSLELLRVLDEIGKAGKVELPEELRALVDSSRNLSEGLGLIKDPRECGLRRLGVEVAHTERHVLSVRFAEVVSALLAAAEWATVVDFLRESPYDAADQVSLELLTVYHTDWARSVRTALALASYPNLPRRCAAVLKEHLDEWFEGADEHDRALIYNTFAVSSEQFRAAYSAMQRRHEVARTSPTRRLAPFLDRNEKQ